MKLHTTRIGRALLFSAAALLGGVAVHAETLFQTFYSFTGGADGQGPAAALTQATDGNFYGTTETGGSAGLGTIFRLSPAGVVTTLFQFSGNAGAYPMGALVQANDGFLYGIAQSTTAYGVAFKISPSTGGFTLLHTFSWGDGYPAGELVYGQDGNFYGIDQLDDGKIFKMTPAGVVSTVFTFHRDIEGSGPHSLVAGTDGNFYGVTGGHSNDYGTVFKLTPSGTLTTLYVFTDYFTGGYPADIMQASDGNLYGTTQSGLVYKLSTAGAFSPLSYIASSPLVEGNDGFIYGVSSSSGLDGALLKVGFDGSVTTVPYSDSYLAAYSRLIRASDGRLYGTSQYGGTNQMGWVYRINPSATHALTVEVLETNSPAPGIPGAKFSSIGEPATNSAGGFAFFGGMTGTGITTANKYGIWANGQLIARSGTGTAPGTNGGVFKTFFDPIMNENGAVAFRAQLIQGVANTDTTNDIGVWANELGFVRLIAREGTQAPGTADGVTFLTINDFVQPGAYVSDSEAEDPTSGMLLIATLTGTGVVTANNQGIWAIGRDKTLQLVVRKGDTVNGKVVKSLSFLPTITNAPGQARGFSPNTGNFIYKAGFTDGTFSVCKVILN